MTIDLPEYLASVDYYEKESSLLDRTLYRLCEEHPCHTDIGAVNAKLWLIGRGFSTGVERQIKSSGVPGSSLEKMAVHLRKNGNAVDQIIQDLRQLKEPLDLEKLQSVVAEHGKFCRLASRIAYGNRVLVSFASKYLHFHAPIVPIYDQWADWQAWRMRRKDNLMSFKLPKGGNEAFYWYCLCFWQVYANLRTVSDRVNVRLTECYLMWLAS
jgi:hypothetical protein